MDTDDKILSALMAIAAILAIVLLATLVWDAKRDSEAKARRGEKVERLMVKASFACHPQGARFFYLRGDGSKGTWVEVWCTDDSFRVVTDGPLETKWGFPK